MALTIITYGAGEALQQMFNAIAMLMNGHSNNIIRPLFVLTASFGGFWAISKALFSLSYESLITRFFFPLLCIPALFLIPTTTVHIEDILAKEGSKAINKTYKVDHVPLLFARFVEFTSSFGYKLTEAVETIMHVPNDFRYHSTGMIFAADNVLDTKKYKINNGLLEQNLRRFSKQCLLYDVALGRYSIDELKKSSDLWDLFERKTSNVRMISYCDSQSPGKCSYVSCKEAIARMKPFLEQEKQYYVGLDILGHLDLTFQALTKLQNYSGDLIKQQLVMNLLANEYNGNHFAKARTENQFFLYLETIGSTASNALVYTRNILEALIYFAFIFVLPLSLLPGGLKIIINWAWMVIWIQTWPPFFAVINYIIQIIAQSKSAAIFVGLAQDQIGLSFFTNVGLQHLHDHMIGAAKFLLSSVPLISYALLKGGMHAFSNITSSLISPIQSAASTAAAEQASGNYSFANTSFGQSSYHNTSGFQNNLAPSISDGFFTDHQGASTKIYGTDENILQQNVSRLRTGISVDRFISQGLQINEQQAQSLVESTSKTYMESLSNYGKMTADISEHFANSKNYNENLFGKEGYSFQESTSYLQSIAENWGKQYGFSARESMEGLICAAVGGEIGFGRWFSASSKVNGSYNLGASKEEIVNSALSVASSSSFQCNLQKITDFASSKTFTDSQDEGSRFVTSYAQSVDNMRSSQQSHQAALSNLHQVSENVLWAQQNSHSIKQSLDQEFINWAQDKFQYSGGLDQVDKILSRGSEVEKQNLFNEFSKDIDLMKVGVFTANESLSADYQRANIQMLNNQEEKNILSNNVLKHLEHHGESLGLLKWNMAKEKNKVSSEYERFKDNHIKHAGETSIDLQNERNNAAQRFDNKNEEYLVNRALRHLRTKDSLSTQYKTVEKPLWTEE